MSFVILQKLNICQEITILFAETDIIKIDFNMFDSFFVECVFQFFDRQRLFTTIFNPTRLANGEGSTLGTLAFDIELVSTRRLHR